MSAAGNEIKQALTAWVQSKLGEWEHDAPAVVESVEVHPVSSQETVMRVKTEKSGIHYLTVKVTANI